MPRGDGTGPQGMGPMTGRAAGYCAGGDVPGYANPMPGRGYGRGRGGRGRGYGWGRGVPPGYSGGYPWGAEVPYGAPVPGPVDEKTMLERQKEALEAQLARMNERLASLQESQKP